MAKDQHKAQAIAYARQELEDISRELDDLNRLVTAKLTEQKHVAEYLSRLTGEPVSLNEPTSAGAPAAAKGTGPAAPETAAFTPSFDGDKAYHSRAFNKKVVSEAIEMILGEGRPMSAPEINQRHSARAVIPTEMLYRLMYNRVLSGVLMTIDGAFWPESKTLPAGYDLAAAKRSSTVTKQ